MKRTTKKSSSKPENQADRLDFSKNKLETFVDVIEDTPFTIKKDEKGWTAGIGTYALTKDFKTKEEAKEAVMKITWNQIVKVIICLIDSNNKENFNLNKLK